MAVELPSASEVSSSPREYKSSPEYAHHASDDEYYRELRERLERDEESGYGSGYEEEGSAASESAIVSLSDVSRRSRDGEWELSSGRSRECSGSGRSGYGSREVSGSRRERRAAAAGAGARGRSRRARGAARGDGGGERVGGWAVERGGRRSTLVRTVLSLTMGNPAHQPLSETEPRRRATAPPPTVALRALEDAPRRHSWANAGR